MNISVVICAFFSFYGTRVFKSVRPTGNVQGLNANGESTMEMNGMTEDFSVSISFIRGTTVRKPCLRFDIILKFLPALFRSSIFDCMPRQYYSGSISSEMDCDSLITIHL